MSSANLLAGVARSDDSVRNEMLMDARARVLEAVGATSSGEAAVAYLGGCERASTMLVLASLDTDGDGNLTQSEHDRYLAVGAQLVESTKNFHLNTGVVSALVLSVVFGLAYEEHETLASLAETTDWNQQAISDLTSFLAMQTAVSTSFVTVLLSSRLFTQITFWMPDLDAQLWYIDASANVTSWLESCKNFTLFATLLTLGLEGAVTTTWLNGLAFVPLVLCIVFYSMCESGLSRKSAQRLGTGLIRLAAMKSAAPSDETAA